MIQNLLNRLFSSSETISFSVFLCGLFSLLFIPISGISQNVYGIKKSIEIPFEYHNDFIVVKIFFQKRLPLNFILDTGAEHTILLKKEIAEFLEIPYERRIQIVGSDMQEDLYAYLARRIHFQMGQINIPNQSILVLEKDYLELGKRVGVEIEGIIGADIFKAYRLSINYDTRTIKISPSSAKKPRNFEIIPLEMYRNKPYLNSVIELSDTTSVPVKLLIDTGAGLALLLHTDTHPDLELPEQVILGQVGMGLGGAIEGFLGRVEGLPFGESSLKLLDVVTNFQELNSDLEMSQLNARNGIIGNKVWRRFQFIIDYPQEKLYLKPNRRYKKKFKFDRSGLVMIAGGKNLNEYYVSKVVANSPAAEVGILRGDRIIRINGMSTSYLMLSGIAQRFKRKVGRKIKLVLFRDDVKVKKQFILRNLI